MLIDQGILWPLLKGKHRTVVELLVRLQGTEWCREQRSENGDDLLMFVAKNVRGKSGRLIDVLLASDCDVDARTSDGLRRWQVSRGR